MHPAIEMLATKYGIKIAERCASDSFVFDGETLATWYCKGGRAFVDPFDGQAYPEGEHIRYTDHDLLHEIAHFVVAEPCQKDLPEYGLFVGIGNEGIRSYANAEFQKLLPDYQGLVDSKEQDIQEYMVHFLCAYWGQKYGISPKFSSHPESATGASWEAYLLYKTNEYNERFVETEQSWKALFRLQEMLAGAP